jgi:hypothetical protein
MDPSKKNELTQKIVIVLFEFMKTSNLNWDETYFRFLMAGPGSGYRSEWLFRKERKLSYLPDEFADPERKCMRLIEPLFVALFDEIANEGSDRPVVAVATIDSNKNYKIKFEHEDFYALQIGMMNVGLSNSYFNGEVDVDEEVIGYRKDIEELNAKGQSH